MKKDIRVAGAYFNICIKGEDFEMLNRLAKDHKTSTQDYLESIIDEMIQMEWVLRMETLGGKA
jgi:hypothetical protein